MQVNYSAMLYRQDFPSFVYYLPIGTSIIAAIFLVALIKSAAKKSWPSHLIWWAIGVFFYGLGTTLESSITLFGNSLELNRWWYWAGAILGGYPLATGSVYLAFKKKSTAHLLTGLSLIIVIIASVAIFLSPLETEMLDPVRPSGNILSWQWIRSLTPFINIYAATFLIGTAVHSSIKFARTYRMNAKENLSTVDTNNQQALFLRAWGTIFIGFGGILPGIGGSLTKANDLPEALYIGEFFGIIFIWLGHTVCGKTVLNKE